MKIDVQVYFNHPGVPEEVKDVQVDGRRTLERGERKRVNIRTVSLSPQVVRDTCTALVHPPLHLLPLVLVTGNMPLVAKNRALVSRGAD